MSTESREVIVEIVIAIALILIILLVIYWSSARLDNPL